MASVKKNMTKDRFFYQVSETFLKSDDSPNLIRSSSNVVSYLQKNRNAPKTASIATISADPPKPTRDCTIPTKT